MKDLQSLCKEVLELDEKAKPGPWGWTYDGSSDFSIGDKEDPQSIRVAGYWNSSKDSSNAELITHYRTSAVQLAKGCLKLMEALQYYAKHHKNASKVCQTCKSVTFLNLGDNGERAKKALDEVTEVGKKPTP